MAFEQEHDSDYRIEGEIDSGSEEEEDDGGEEDRDLLGDGEERESELDRSEN